MKYLLPLFILMTACSKSNNLNPKNIENSETEIERSLEASATSVTSPSSSTIVEDVIQVPFGTILNTEQKSLRATIRNNSTEGESIVSVTRGSSLDNYFEQTSNSCLNIKPKSTCDIRMVFNGKVSPQNAGGSFSGQWVLNFSDGSTKTVQMNIQVEVPAPPTQEEIDSQIAAQLANIVFIPSGSIEMGEISDKESKTISIQIKNNNSTPITFPTSVQTPFTLITGCSTISAKGTCTARVSLSGAGKSGQQSSSFSYGTKSTPISAFVKTTADILASTVLVENINESTGSIVFGDINPTSIITRQVTFTNKSNLPVTLQTNLSNPNFTITSNSCNNSQVAIHSSCTVRVSINGAGKAAGLLTGTLNYGTTGLVNLSANILSEEAVQQQRQEQARLNSNVIMSYLGVDYNTLQTLNLGSKNQGQLELLIFNLKNIGAAPVNVSQASFASNIAIVSNSCNTFLFPNSSCQIRASLNPQTQSALDLSVNLGFETRVFPISFQYLPAGSEVATPPLVQASEVSLVTSFGTNGIRPSFHSESFPDGYSYNAEITSTFANTSGIYILLSGSGPLTIIKKFTLEGHQDLVFASFGSLMFQIQGTSSVTPYAFVIPTTSTDPSQVRCPEMVGDSLSNIYVYCNFSSNNTSFIIKFNSSGTRDTSFGLDGVLSLPVGFSNSVQSPENRLFVAQDKLIVVSLGYGTFDNKLIVTRYNNNGVLDSSFNGGNILEINPPSDGFLNQSDWVCGLSNNSQNVTALDSGSIFISRMCFPNGLSDISHADIIKIDNSGSFDSSFGVLGKLAVPWPYPGNQGFAGFLTLVKNENEIYTLAQSTENLENINTAYLGGNSQFGTYASKIVNGQFVQQNVSIPYFFPRSYILANDGFIVKGITRDEMNTGVDVIAKLAYENLSYGSIVGNIPVNSISYNPTFLMPDPFNENMFYTVLTHTLGEFGVGSGQGYYAIDIQKYYK